MEYIVFCDLNVILAMAEELKPARISRHTFSSISFIFLKCCSFSSKPGYIL